VKFPVLSHTFLNDWDNCPRKAARKYIIKDLPRGEQTEQMKWGDEVHKAFELRIKHGTGFPAGMERFEPIAAPLVAAGAQAEKMLGIDSHGRSCDFFAKNVWLRGKVDATVRKDERAAIFDWKTGKRREDPSELHIHALLLRAWDSSIVKVTASYVWLQEDKVGKPYDVSNVMKTMEDICHTADQVERAIETEHFPPRQNPLCGWCPVFDCEFNKGEL
jgi:hypothetical protein